MRSPTKDVCFGSLCLLLVAVASAQDSDYLRSQATATEQKIEACSARLEQARAELAAEKERLPELARAKRDEQQQKLRELDAEANASEEALDAAQEHISEHTTSCDVVQAQRTGQRVTAEALRRHNAALAEARDEIRHHQAKLAGIRTAKRLASVAASGDSPEESASKVAAIQLQQRVKSLEQELSGLTQSLSMTRAQIRLADALKPKPGDASTEGSRRPRDRDPEPSRRSRQDSDSGAGRFDADAPTSRPSPPVTVAPVPRFPNDAGQPAGAATSPNGSGGANDDAYDRAAADRAAADRADADRAARAEMSAANAKRDLSSVIDRLLADSQASYRDLASDAWNLTKDKVSEEARQATDRLAAIAGDSSCSAPMRWAAGVAGTFTETFTGDTTRQEYGAAAEKVAMYIDTMGATAGLAPSGQAASAGLSAISAGFSLAGKLMRADKPWEEAKTLGSAAGVVDIIRSRVKNGYLGAVLDGVSVASQLAPGEDQDFVGAAITVFEGIASTKVDAHFARELEGLKAERAGGRWARRGVYADMQRGKQQQSLLETAIGAPGNMKALEDKAPKLLDEITGAGAQGKDPHK